MEAVAAAAAAAVEDTADVVAVGLEACLGRCRKAMNNDYSDPLCLYCYDQLVNKREKDFISACWRCMKKKTCCQGADWIWE